MTELIITGSTGVIALIVSYKALKASRNGNKIENEQLQHSIQESQKRLCQHQTDRITTLETKISSMETVDCFLKESINEIKQKLDMIVEKLI